MQNYTADFGFIYNDKRQQKLISHLITQLMPLSMEHKRKIVLFPIENLDLDGAIISGTIIEGNNVHKGQCDIPPFIYNLALHSIADKMDKMRSLRKMENTLIINPINRFIQGIIFEMLSSLTDLQPYLLPAVSLNTTTLMDYLDKYDSFFILPEKSFHKPKAVTIKKNHDEYIIYIGANGQRCKKEDILSYIKKMTHKKNHLLIKGIDRLNNGEVPLEMKIFLQKNWEAKWSITATIANQGIFSRYESPFEKTRYPSNNLCIEEIEDYTNCLDAVSKQIGRFLDYYIPFVGSLTFDFIFDDTRSPYLIYVSGFEQDQNIIGQMDSESQINLLQNAFYYLLFLMNNSGMEKGAHHELDKS
ncbi:YheC/YheD family protein [Ureibacillus sp. GCM10028918]|uniref:YheC/YheD family protein n=1 Tax=Ureibacillus sp. GCM10028918 TaxID=3273429 RepID=UPI00360A3A3A